MKDNTYLVHGGRQPSRQHGMVNPPVYHASTVLFPSVAALEAAEKNPFEGVYYGRFGTPLHFEFERAIADLEHAAGAVSVCSGLAAISVALLAVVKAGDRVLVADNVYAPTRKLCDGLLARMGVSTVYFDPCGPDDLTRLLESGAAAVFLESPGSLTFEMTDIPALAATARAAGAAVLMDNTWATPIGFRAIDAGVDISIHSATKYIVGHADAMLGVLACGDRWFDPVRRCARQLGYCAGPDDVYLGLRGLRTLSTRLDRHAHNADRLCAWLDAQPEVAAIRYPAWPSDPGYALWRRDFERASGLFAILLQPGSEPGIAPMLDDLSLFGMGFSWGGYESLVLPVNPAGIRSATRWDTRYPCLRIHAGLEDADDLVADLDAGFDRLRRAIAG